MGLSIVSEIEKLFDNNRRWSQRLLETDPHFFSRLSSLQSPKFLWIGCSDSRVPANQILGLAPGEVFVHRNVANLVVNTDMNCLSVIQYAVEILKIEHIIVCGHYRCGGVQAACGCDQLGLIDNWLRDIKNTYNQNRVELEKIGDKTLRADRLCELNVLSQVRNVCHTAIVQNAWAQGRKLAVHGLIYSLNDGLLQDLAVQVTGLEQLEEIYRIGAKSK
ncbi:MAG: carbonate dehydratase [Proteobacteria bacterium]|nr:carbonate dehydratase [Pseudomonadota bacterium]